MRMRGGVRRFQDGGVNPALQRPQRPQAWAPATINGASISNLPIPPGTTNTPAPGGGGASFAPAQNPGSMASVLSQMNSNPNSGVTPPAAPGGGAPGLDPQAIQQALQQRHMNGGMPPQMQGAPGTPPGMPPGPPLQQSLAGAPPMPGPPPGGPPPMPPGAGAPPGAGMPPGLPPGMNPQMNPQVAAMMAQRMGGAPQRPMPPGAMPGMAKGGAVDGDAKEKKSRRKFGAKEEAAEDIPEAPAKKAKGGPIKHRKPKAKAMPVPMTPGGDQDSIPAPPPPGLAAGPAAGPPPPAGPPPGMKKGGKLKKKAKAAHAHKKPVRKAKGGECEKMAAGGAMKVRRGFPNVNAAPKKKAYAQGGKVRGAGAATKGTRFQGIF